MVGRLWFSGRDKHFPHWRQFRFESSDGPSVRPHVLQFYFCFLHCISDFGHLYDTSTSWESHKLPYVSNTLFSGLAVKLVAVLFCNYCVITLLLLGLIKADYNGMCSDTSREIFGEVNDKDVYYILNPLFIPKITFEKSSLFKFNTKQCEGDAELNRSWENGPYEEWSKE